MWCDGFSDFVSRILYFCSISLFAFLFFSYRNQTNTSIATANARDATYQIVKGVAQRCHTLVVHKHSAYRFWCTIFPNFRLFRHVTWCLYKCRGSVHWRLNQVMITVMHEGQTPPSIESIFGFLCPLYRQFFFFTFNSFRGKSAGCCVFSRAYSFIYTCRACFFFWFLFLYPLVVAWQCSLGFVVQRFRITVWLGERKKGDRERGKNV